MYAGYHPGASAGYVRATRTSLPRWVRTGGAGRLAPRAPRTVRTGYAYQPRPYRTYRAPWHPRRCPSTVRCLTSQVLPGYFTPDNMGFANLRTSRGATMYFLPWLGHTVVGSTDKKCDASPNPSPAPARPR